MYDHIHRQIAQSRTADLNRAHNPGGRRYRRREKPPSRI
jgi:hypothetical protein